MHPFPSPGQSRRVVVHFELAAATQAAADTESAAFNTHCTCEAVIELLQLDAKLSPSARFITSR